MRGAAGPVAEALLVKHLHFFGLVGLVDGVGLILRLVYQCSQVGSFVGFVDGDSSSGSVGNIVCGFVDGLAVDVANLLALTHSWHLGGWWRIILC